MYQGLQQFLSFLEGKSLGPLPRKILVSSAMMGMFAPFVSANFSVSTVCMANNISPSQAIAKITMNGKNVTTLFNGASLAVLQQLFKSCFRNVIWLKKPYLDDVFPKSSNYIVSGSFAASEVLLTPLTLALTRTYEGTAFPRHFKEWFAGSTLATLKLLLTSSIYVNVKPYSDNLVKQLGMNPNSIIGSFISAIPSTIFITLPTHPLELAMRKMQLEKKDNYTFIKSTNRFGFFNVANNIFQECVGLASRDDWYEAMRFLMRGWQPRMGGNFLLSIAFNIMIYMGKDSAKNSSITKEKISLS